MIDADQIGKTVTAYLERHPDETRRLAPITAALAAPPGDLTSRKTLPGHVTCSAIVVNPAGHVLHIRHNALNKWLRPGGHLESQDLSLAGAASREVAEETGIPAQALTLVDDVPADIDVHPIPENPAKDEGDHLHYDMRFVFTVAADTDVQLQAEEVNDSAWLPIVDLKPAQLAGRVADLVGANA
ncbi:NUDIX hydrolase [Hamadaea sp. NPDC050747]|uniref:NUDIX hydrolase n=1 Tax=Hamadaea sp. NPDC050747 TaxID=3155789 RepID=UPI0033D61C89